MRTLAGCVGSTADFREFFDHLIQVVQLLRSDGVTKDSLVAILANSRAHFPSLSGITSMNAAARPCVAGAWNSLMDIIQLATLMTFS